MYNLSALADNTAFLESGRGPDQFLLDETLV